MKVKVTYALFSDSEAYEERSVTCKSMKDAEQFIEKIKQVLFEFEEEHGIRLGWYTFENIIPHLRIVK